MGVRLTLRSSPYANSLAAQVHIKPAQQHDCEDLWHWRNDPLTRANSLNTDKVSYDQHCAWFDSLMSDASQFLVIGAIPNKSFSENMHKIGMVRFDIVPISELNSDAQKPVKSANKVIVSINLNPDFRAKGLSVSLLTNAIESFKESIVSASSPIPRNIKYIEATIKEGNKASIKCFENAGFVDILHIKNQQQAKMLNSSQRQFHLLLV
jgi:UDP-2,4-diacetamido-2,4,6-trideoxy-beta-L-altropyranose hydrolase